MSLLPGVMPMSGRGRAVYQPIWADDVAACVMAVLDPQRSVPSSNGTGHSTRFELAGPETLSHEAIVRLVLRSLGRRRALLHLPTPLVSRGLRAVEALARDRAFASWDAAELLEVPMTSRLGTADAERLGTSPQPMAAVLGVR
jgi:NADH dehydrogenase